MISVSPLTIWSNRWMPPDLTARFEERVAPHRVVWSADRAESNLSACLRDPALLEVCQVAYGQPHVDDLLESRSLKWAQLTTAGYTRYDRDDLRRSLRSRGVALCNASGVYDEPCAQHVAAMMLSLARRLPNAQDAQRADRSWPYLSLRAGSRLLGPGQVVLLVGYGAIAKRLAEILRPFGMELIGFRRTVRGDEVVPTHAIERLDEFLPRADHVVNILPASPSTRHLFDRPRLTRMKSGATFYNVGRGDTVDQDALVEALRDGPIGQAYLDVTTPEPLPPGHALWTLPNCLVTPHTAGGTFDEAERQVEHFLENLRRFERGEALRDRVL